MSCTSIYCAQTEGFVTQSLPEVVLKFGAACSYTYPEDLNMQSFNLTIKLIKVTRIPYYLSASVTDQSGVVYTLEFFLEGDDSSGGYSPPIPELLFYGTNDVKPKQYTCSVPEFNAFIEYTNTNPTGNNHVHGTVVYALKLHRENGHVSIVAKIGVSKLLSLPANSTSTLPQIEGSIYSTDNGENICSSEFSFIMLREVETYMKYSPPMQTVMIGLGCTVAQKAASLGVSFRNIVSYGMLRYALSKQLFGSFNIDYLKQRYYKEFLTKLENSVWNGYRSYFTNTFFGYNKYFIK